MTIHFLTLLGPNAVPLAEFLKATAIQTSSSQIDLRWWSIVDDNHPQSQQFTNLGRIIQKRKGGWIHGAGLNLGVKLLREKIQPDDYIIIIDPDMCITLKNWDLIFTQYFKDDEKLGILGCEYMFPWRYQNFPCVILAMFPASVLYKLEIDFSPIRKKYFKKYILKDKSIAKIVNLPLGKLFVRDAGWQLPLIMKPAGYNFICIKYSHQPQLPPLRKVDKWSHLAEEFYLDGILTAVHLGRSRQKTSAPSAPAAKAWIRILQKYINEKKVLHN